MVSVGGAIITAGGGIGLVDGINVIIRLLGVPYTVCTTEVVEVTLANAVHSGKGNGLLLELPCE